MMLRILENKLRHTRNTRYLKNKLKNNERVVFLNSFPRSGNTWTRHIIADYLAASTGLEIAKHRCVVHVSHFIPSIVEHRLATHLRLDLARLPVIATHHEYFTHQRYLGSANAARASHIFLYRNPVDCLVSWYHYNKDRIGNNVGDIDVFCRREYPKWKQFTTSYLNANVELEVCSYESMLQAPEYSFGHILEFLGFAVNQAILRSTIDAWDATKRLVKEEQKGTNKSHLQNVGKIGKGREQLNAETIEFLESQSASIEAQVRSLLSTPQLVVGNTEEET